MCLYRKQTERERESGTCWNTEWVSGEEQRLHISSSLKVLYFIYCALMECAWLQRLPLPHNPSMSLSCSHTNTQISKALLTSSSQTHSLPLPRTSCLYVETSDNTAGKPPCLLALLAENECHVTHWFVVGSISKNLKTGWGRMSHRMNLLHVNTTDGGGAVEDKGSGWK